MAAMPKHFGCPLKWLTLRPVLVQEVGPKVAGFESQRLED